MASLTSLPTELTSLILTALTSLHTCPACAQTDLTSLSLTSRRLNILTTPHLYSSLTLRPHDTTTYSSRLQSLLTTLTASPRIASLVRKIRFSHEEMKLTQELWPKITALTPNLTALQGVDTFFPESEEVEEDELPTTAGTTDGQLAVLLALPKLKQVVLHHEVLPCALSTLLKSWPSLRTLVVGNVTPSYEHDEAETSIADLAVGLSHSKSLQNVYFHDCDLEWTSSSERAAGVWQDLGPLKRLGVEYSLGSSFSMDGVRKWLEADRRRAEMLEVFDFHRQLRAGSGVREFGELLEVAKGLKRCSVGLTWRKGDRGEGEAVVLRGGKLEEVRWVCGYMRIKGREEVVGEGEEEWEGVLVRSLKEGGLPRLRKVTVGEWEGGWEKLKEVCGEMGVEVVVEEGVRRREKRGSSSKCEVGAVEVVSGCVDPLAETVEAGEAREDEEQEAQPEEKETDLEDKLWDEEGDLVDLWYA